MLVHGKSYLVEKRNGEMDIYRGGERVGHWPLAGYNLTVFGVCTATAGTELAAHALAEVYSDVWFQSRKWVLSEEEYDEHVRILADDNRALMAKYPYLPEEAQLVEASNLKYAKIIEEGRTNIRAKLLNLNPYQSIVWDKSHNKRPGKMPFLGDHPSRSPGM